MLREILTADKNSLTITLPDNLVGKLIEVIAFEIAEVQVDGRSSKKKIKPSQLRGFLSQESAALLHEHIEKSRAEWNIL